MRNEVVEHNMRWKRKPLAKGMEEVVCICRINMNRATSYNLFAGRLTPAASVDVQVRRQRVPCRYASSMTLLSSEVRPEWW